MKSISFAAKILALLLMCSVPAVAQSQRARGNQRAQNQPQRAERGVGAGHVPARGPAPAPKAVPRAAPARGGGEANDRRGFRDQPTHPEAPHVHAENDKWIGHDTGRNDDHYRLAKPWEHGRFAGAIGAHHIYRLRGGSRDRFGFEGGFFQVAPYDYDYVNGWLWDSDDIVLYPVSGSRRLVSRLQRQARHVCARYVPGDLTGSRDPYDCHPPPSAR